MQAIYYRDRAGREPVREAIDRLTAPEQAAMGRQIERLNLCEPSAPPLPHPWSSQIQGELRELRCHHGSAHYRILYRRSANLFVLLHMLRKTTGPLPRQDVVVAERRWDDFKRRMDAVPRIPPRAIGHDAP